MEGMRTGRCRRRCNKKSLTFMLFLPAHDNYRDEQQLLDGCFSPISATKSIRTVITTIAGYRRCVRRCHRPINTSILVILLRVEALDYLVARATK